MDLKTFLEKVFGSHSDREIKRIEPLAKEVEDLDQTMQKLTDAELQAKTAEFRKRLEDKDCLDNLLPEAFAVVREAAVRVLGMKHYHVQIVAGIVLHQGRIAEMKTGEGKTLMATLPVYLNALSGKGVHIVTVNDYLAERDKEQMGKLYEFLGLSVGCILNDMDSTERRAAYGADITYGTNNEFGFDYLRDNMVIYKNEMVQRDLNYCIVDEVDSILVDEARTPLIISGMGDKSTKLYGIADQFVRTLQGRVVDPNEKKDMFDREYVMEKVDFTKDEKARNVTLTEVGIEKAEHYFSVENLSDPVNMSILHHVNQALKANNVMKRDIDYVVNDGEILIVDEFTGRLMNGRRYSEGLHQAIEAKEGLEVNRESKTLATITFQNYFRMYKKLSGMTGTAKTEEAEFREIYNVDVIEVPTNKPVIRIDSPDAVYTTLKGKLEAAVREIKEKNETGQPVLVGTISIEMSELLSKMLKQMKVPHEVLNAKQHEREAEIVAQAGRYGMVTIATNMAGRGTDIVLGGNSDFIAKHEMKKKGYTDEMLTEVDSLVDTDDQEILAARAEYRKYLEKAKQQTDQENKDVIAAGGLHIIGTERHESRRIDNQLRGRAGRQGDPGSSRFFVSLEDDLMRLFGGERVKTMIDSLGMPEDEALEHKMLSRSIENAQKKIEGNNFSIRKHVLKYDDVMNNQREVIYAERRKVLEGENLKDHVLSMVEGFVSGVVDVYTAGAKYPEEWDITGLENAVNTVMPIGELEITDVQNMEVADLNTLILDKAKAYYEDKEAEVGEEELRELERVILLRMVDTKWMDHIDAMDQLKQGIGLRAMGQQDPVRAYQVEGFDMFEEMINSIQEDTIKNLFHLERAENLERERVAEPISTNMSGDEDRKKKPTVVKDRTGRNDLCPCGSGKKYKKCCGEEQ